MRPFGTTTPEVLAWQTWLTEHHVTPVAMESTGSSGKPLFHLLESRFTTWLVNPAPIQAVPGRKTEVKDAAGIADLLPHGLLRPSFIPDRAPRELMRYRKRLIEERARARHRIQKVLEAAHSKLGSVLSDVRGASGARIVAVLADESRTRRRWRRWRMSACAPRPPNSWRPSRGGWRRTHASSGSNSCSIWTPWTPSCRRWMRSGRPGWPL